MARTATGSRKVSRLVRRGALTALLATVSALPVAGIAAAPASAATRMTGARSAAIANSAAHVAGAQKGKRYVYGGAGPSVFDCSGLVQYAYKRAGIRIPRTADQQYRASKHIPLRSLRVGDVVFFHDSRGYVYHDAIYAGFGAVWNAPHTGAVVRLQRVWSNSIYFGRFV
jgi:cell wall-associated NlpC family hydrolase